MQADDAVPTADVVEEEVLAQLAGQKHRRPLPSLAVALIIAAMAWADAPRWAILGWLCWVVGVLVLRHDFLERRATRRSIRLARRLRWAILLSAANGTSFALSLLFFPYLDGYERIVQTLLVLAMCTGAIATTAGYRPVFLSFLVPPIVAITLAWASSSLLDSHRWIEFSVAVLAVFYGTTLSGMARDTQRVFFDSFNMRKQQAEMNDRLREALQQAEAANSAKTRFLASASHDLRQPLHTLSLFAEALWLRPLDDGTREIASHMRSALLGLGTQLDGLLDISKLDARLIEARFAPVDIAAALRRLHEQYAPEAARLGLEWRVEAPDRLTGQTDPVLLERILRNLVDNAFKYTRVGGIVLRAAASGEQVLVDIADTGCGIAAIEQERVFEEFYQVGNAERSRAQGLGLGLSIVRRLAALLNIGVRLTSAPGVGTTVQLTVAAAAPATAGAPRDEAPAPIAGLHVLVIDDEEEVRVAMRTLLAELGCTADLASSSDEAVEAARRTPPDIAIADFRLRGDDNGVEAVRRLRRDIAALPALLLSGDTAPSRLVEAQAAGIDLLHKPVTLDPLLRAIALQMKPRVAHDKPRAAAA